MPVAAYKENEEGMTANKRKRSVKYWIHYPLCSRLDDMHARQQPERGEVTLCIGSTEHVVGVFVT